MKSRNRKWSQPLKKTTVNVGKQLVATIMVLLSLFNQTGLFAQTNNATVSVKPYHIAICYNKTSNLIFPFAIKSVDRGSAAVLVQKAKGIDNILQVKASSESFPQTNLSVITSDGALYSFIVDYKAEPSPLNFSLSKDSKAIVTKEVTAELSTVNDATVEKDAKQIADAAPFLHRLVTNDFDITLRLDGIYVDNNVMYFQLWLENNSNINYTIDVLRFYIRDKQKSKRTALQEVNLDQLYVNGNITEIKGKSSQVVVIAVPKFTIPDKKFLAIQMMEKNGGRHLHLSLSNKKLLKAKRPSNTTY